MGCGPPGCRLFRKPGKPAREVGKVPMPFLVMPGWVRTWDEASGANDDIFLVG